MVISLRLLSLRPSIERDTGKYIILRSYNYIAVIELTVVLHTSPEAVLQTVVLQRIRRLVSHKIVA